MEISSTLTGLSLLFGKTPGLVQGLVVVIPVLLLTFGSRGNMQV